jgi:hypothetical protein
VFEIVVLGCLLVAASALAYVAGRVAGRKPVYSQKRRRIAELTAERNGLRREVESLRTALSEARATVRPEPAAVPVRADSVWSAVIPEDAGSRDGSGGRPGDPDARS